MAKTTTGNKFVKTAQKTVAKTGKAIATKPTTALYIGLGIVGIYGVYLIAKKLKQASDFTIGNETGAGGGNPNPNTGNNVPWGANISKNQAQVIASQLYEILTTWFANNDRIIEILAGKNSKDFAMISEAYGEPRFDGVAEAFWPFPKRNLSHWLFSKLNDEETRRLKQVMPGVF